MSLEIDGRYPAIALSGGHWLDDDVEVIDVAFDVDGAAYACSRRTGAEGLGSPAEAIAAAAGRPMEDPWVRAACDALAREREWGRRDALVIERWRGEMFHVSPSVNRASIAQHGLDWRRMGATRGIAGSLVPELPATFLTDFAEDERGFFVGFAREPVDVWAVRVDGLWLENGPDGWFISPQPIDSTRLRITLLGVTR